MSLFRRNKQKLEQAPQDRISKMEIAAHLRKHQTLPVAARTLPKPRPAVRRLRRKVSPEVRVYPPSRWRAMRKRYADERAEVDAAPVTMDVFTPMPKSLAKQLAHPRRRYRMTRPHGRQATVGKVYR